MVQIIKELRKREERLVGIDPVDFFTNKRAKMLLGDHKRLRTNAFFIQDLVW